MSRNPSSPPACDASLDACDETATSSPPPSGEPPAPTPDEPSPAQKAEPVGAAHEIPVRIIDGTRHVLKADGSWFPESQVKAQELLEDALVRGLIAEASELSERLAAFRARCFEEVAIHNALLADKYGAKGRGVKGNQTLATFDALMRLQIQVSDLVSFGPELQTAKLLIDECLSEWVADSCAELRAIVDFAFQMDKEGQINRGRLLSLRRMNVEDPRWVRGMEAIADSIRITGSKQYVRFHRRRTHLAAWTHLSLDSATA
jgi:hypothetical protein